MKKLKVALAFVLAVLSSAALAQRALVPVIDYKDVMVATSSGKPLTPEQVRDAIVDAGKRLNWEMTFTANNGLVGTLLVNNKHTVSIDIGVAADRYSIAYRNSINMKYRISSAPPNVYAANAVPEGTRVIHPAYDQWVKTLMAAIDSELKRL